MKIEGLALAFDRATARSYDRDGRLHIATNNISKATVNPYRGNEIPNWEDLGLEPNKIYKLLRDPKELEKAAPSFNNLPLLSRHVPLTSVTHRPELVVGSTGTDADFSSPYLRNSLVIWTQSAIEGIEQELQHELSSSYHYTADMTPGEFEGQPYDGVMRDIIGNHVALVVEGRAGSDVVVGDSKLTSGEVSMKQVLTRKAAATAGALAVFIQPKLAADAAIDLSPILAKLTAKNFAEQKKAIIANITKATKGKLAADASMEGLAGLLDALEGTEVAEGADIDPDTDLPVAELPAIEKPPGEDADPLEAIKTLLGEKATPEIIEQIAKLLSPAAADEEDDKEKDMKDVVTKPAMDAALKAATEAATTAAQKNFQAIREAERAVRPYVGEISVAFDSASAIYEHTLKALGADTAGVDPSAFPSMLKLIPVPGSKKTDPAPKLAADAAQAKAFADRFPGVNRIGHA